MIIYVGYDSGMIKWQAMDGHTRIPDTLKTMAIQWCFMAFSSRILHSPAWLHTPVMRPPVHAASDPGSIHPLRRIAGEVNEIRDFPVPSCAIFDYGRVMVYDAIEHHGTMDWFKGKFTGKPHISWENLWFPVDFPLNQSIEWNIMEHPGYPVIPPGFEQPRQRYLSCNCLGIVQNGSGNHGLFRTKRPKKIRKFPQVDHRLGLESSGYTRAQYKILYIYIIQIWCQNSQNRDIFLIYKNFETTATLHSPALPSKDFQCKEPGLATLTEHL